MKTSKILLLSLTLIIMSSCRSTKETYKGTSLEGEKVIIESQASTGITFGEALNEDGTGIIKIPYKWYSGNAKVNNKQMAITAAQAEAYATISRVIFNMVEGEIEKAGLANDGAAHVALKSRWEQTTRSVQKGAEPFGDNIVSYNTKTNMYDVTAKVGIRGDKYISFLKNSEFKTDNLSQEELNDFIKVNDAIIKAANGEF